MPRALGPVLVEAGRFASFAALLALVLTCLFLIGLVERPEGMTVLLTRRADKVGRRKLLLISIVGYTVATALTGFLESLAGAEPSEVRVQQVLDAAHAHHVATLEHVGDAERRALHQASLASELPGVRLVRPDELDDLGLDREYWAIRNHAALIDAFTRLGEASGQARWLDEARTVADGETVQVMFDLARNRVVRVPGDLIALFDGDAVKSHWRFTTSLPRTSDEFGLLLRSFLHADGMEPDSVHGAAICSVVSGSVMPPRAPSR